MVIAQGEIWWADMPAPTGSGPGFRRPVLVVQGDSLNTLLKARTTGLPKDSVANASQIIALDRTLLTERAGKLARPELEEVLRGIDVVLGR